jgi:glycosyltransferase involved in cell wall biosynthesis
MAEKYDVCIVCFNYLINDARALNLANALYDLGKSVIVISLDDEINHSFRFTNSCFKLNLNDKLYINMLKFYWNVNKYFKNIKADFYLACELYSLPSTRLIQKNNSGKLIYDSREIFSALGNTYKQPVKQLFFTQLEKYLVKYIDKIIVSGKLDAEYLKKYFNHNTPYFLIMNLPHYKEKVKTNIIREKFEIDNSQKVLLYQGMIMKGRGIESAIYAVKYLEEFVLVVIGNGGRMLEDLKNLVKKENLEDKVFFQEFVPYNELHQWTCSADIGLSLFEPISLSYKLALPNKLFEYSMANIPSISTNLPAIYEIVKDYKFSELIDYPIKRDELIDAIKRVSAADNYKLMEINSSKASEIFNYNSHISTIKEIFEIK